MKNLSFNPDEVQDAIAKAYEDDYYAFYGIVPEQIVGRKVIMKAITHVVLFVKSLDGAQVFPVSNEAEIMVLASTYESDAIKCISFQHASAEASNWNAFLTLQKRMRLNADAPFDVVLSDLKDFNDMLIRIQETTERFLS